MLSRDFLKKKDTLEKLERKEDGFELNIEMDGTIKRDYFVPDGVERLVEGTRANSMGTLTATISLQPLDVNSMEHKPPSRPEGAVGAVGVEADQLGFTGFRRQSSTLPAPRVQIKATRGGILKTRSAPDSTECTIS